MDIPNYNFNPQGNSEITRPIQKLSHRVAKIEIQRTQQFLRACVWKYINPADAGEIERLGQLRDLTTAAKICNAHGLSNVIHPNGKLEFCQHGKVLETLEGWE